MAAAPALIMAQQSKNNNNANPTLKTNTTTTGGGLLNINTKNNNNNNNNNNSSQQQQKEVKAMFHDFLGMKPTTTTTDSPAALAPKNTEATPSASSGGARGPLSTTSDLASERQVGNHLEGIPFYSPRSDISGPEISNRLVGGKRSNSDSTFMGSTREGIQQLAHESVEGLHLMKMLKHGGGGERPRRSNEDEVFYGMQAIKPSSASLILQPSAGSRLDPSVSKWERSIPMAAGAQYPLRGGPVVPLTHHVSANRFRDNNAGPSIISQSAADEGSRTGIKGPGILSAINAGSGASEKNASAALPCGSKPKPGISISEPESSTPSSRQGLTSASRQMTIFYGGQAHVFDDVHPNKADIIMALAGSNGGSWSTSYLPKPNVRPSGENYMSSGECEASVAANAALQRELRGRLYGAGNAAQGASTGDRIYTPTGGHRGSILSARETRNTGQGGEPSTEDRREA